MRTVKACLSIFKIRAAEGFQYRISFLTSSTIGIFWALIEIAVYTVFYTYANNKTAGAAAGMALSQVVTYVWLAQALIAIQPNNVESDILKKIVSGDVGVELCRPLDLYFHWYAKTGAARLNPLLWRGSVVILFAMLLPAQLRMSPPASLLGLICMIIAEISAFFLCTSYAMLITTVRLNVSLGDGPMYMLSLIGMVLSGAYLPLQLWPGFLQKFLLLQPFAGYLDIPLRLYLGTMPVNEAVFAIVIQIAWTFVFIITGKSLMRARLKNLEVQGG